MKKSPQPITAPVAKSDRRVLSSIRRIIRAVDLRSRKLATEFDITGPQLACLHAIVESQPLTVSELSKLVHVSSSTLIGVLDRLELKGHVQRRRDTVDRRRVHVMATESGRTVAEVMLSPSRDDFTQAFNQLAPELQDQIARSLEMIVELMEAQRLPAHPIVDVKPAGLPPEQNESIAGKAYQ
jgi:DNA-binding MarR family transcriptional regulator